MTKLIGICGLIGSGKDTVGQVLVNEYGYTKLSFAGTLKDITAVLFDWDRDMLEGATPESRAEREIPDPFWSEKMGQDWSPRWALQFLGTEVMRNHLHTDIWLNTLANQVRKHDKVVITDCRFPNEIDFVKEHGEIWTVHRGQQPSWFPDAVFYNNASSEQKLILEAAKYDPASMNIHASEYSWAGVAAKHTIDNNYTLIGLTNKVRSLAE
jgi:hypothetical protein